MLVQHINQHINHFTNARPQITRESDVVLWLLRLCLRVILSEFSPPPFTEESSVEPLHGFGESYISDEVNRSLKVQCIYWFMNLFWVRWIICDLIQRRGVVFETSKAESLANENQWEFEISLLFGLILLGALGYSRPLSVILVRSRLLSYALVRFWSLSVTLVRSQWLPMTPGDSRYPLRSRRVWFGSNFH